MYKSLFTLFIISLVFDALSYEISLPRKREDVDYAAVETKNTKSYLSDKAELRKALENRAKELVHTLPAKKMDFFGKLYSLSQGVLTRWDKTSEAFKFQVPQLGKFDNIVEYRISPNHQILAVGISHGGNDWITWEFYNLENAQKISPPVIIKNHGLDEIVFSQDSKGFYYQKMLSPLEDFKGISKSEIRYHLFSSPSLNQDTLIFQDPDSPASSHWNVREISPNLLAVFRVQAIAEITLDLYLINLSEKKLRPEPVVPSNKLWGKFIGSYKGEMFLRTQELTTNYSLFRIIKDNHSFKRKEIKRFAPGEILNQALVISKYIVAIVLKPDLTTDLIVLDLDGQIVKRWNSRQFNHTHAGTLSLTLNSANEFSSHVALGFNSFVAPEENWNLNLKNLTLSVEKSPVAFDASKVSQRLEYYSSFDGQVVPVHTFQRMDQVRSGIKPQFVTVFPYGFLGLPNLPRWDRKLQLMLEMGGVVVMPHVRGGGELGFNWQNIASKNREVTIKDISICGQWVKKRFSPLREQVLMTGRSFGGMMTLIQYVKSHDVFSAFSSVVPISNTLDFFLASGWWSGEDWLLTRNASGRRSLGNQDYEKIKTFSPYHLLQQSNYAEFKKPLILFFGDNDARVEPDQATRFHQELNRLGIPNAYLIEYAKSGHNSRSELFDDLMFIAKQFDVTEIKPLR